MRSAFGHQIEIGVSEHQRHQFIFFHSDAVFAGERAAEFDAVAHNFSGRSDGAIVLSFIALIEKNNRVKISVACVKNISDLKIEAASDFFDVLQHFGQLGARNHSILHVVAGRKASHGAESVFAAFPEQIAFLIIFCEADFARVVQSANFDDLRGLRFDSFGKPFDFDQQNRAAIARKSRVNKIFDGAQRPTVEHFARGGSDRARGKIGDGFGSVGNIIKNREKSFHGFGFLRKLHSNFRDESEGAFGADKNSRQIVAGRFESFSADAKHRAIGQNHLQDRERDSP